MAETRVSYTLGPDKPGKDLDRTGDLLTYILFFILFLTLIYLFANFDLPVTSVYALAILFSLLICGLLPSYAAGLYLAWGVLLVFIFVATIVVVGTYDLLRTNTDDLNI